MTLGMMILSFVVIFFIFFLPPFFLPLPNQATTMKSENLDPHEFIQNLFIEDILHSRPELMFCEDQDEQNQHTFCHG